MSRRKEPPVPNDILDQLLARTDAAAALSQGGLLDTLKKLLLNGRSMRRWIIISGVTTRLASTAMAMAAKL